MDYYISKLKIHLDRKTVTSTIKSVALPSLLLLETWKSELLTADSHQCKPLLKLSKSNCQSHFGKATQTKLLCPIYDTLLN